MQRPEGQRTKKTLPTHTTVKSEGLVIICNHSCLSPEQGKFITGKHQRTYTAVGRGKLQASRKSYFCTALYDKLDYKQIDHWITASVYNDLHQKVTTFEQLGAHNHRWNICRNLQHMANVLRIWWSNCERHQLTGNKCLCFENFEDVEMRLSGLPTYWLARFTCYWFTILFWALSANYFRCQVKQWTLFDRNWDVWESGWFTSTTQ